MYRRTPSQPTWSRRDGDTDDTVHSYPMSRVLVETSVGRQRARVDGGVIQDILVAGLGVLV